MNDHPLQIEGEEIVEWECSIIGGSFLVGDPYGGGGGAAATADAGLSGKLGLMDSKVSRKGRKIFPN